MPVKVIDRQGNPVWGANVVLTELAPKWLKRQMELNGRELEPLRGSTDDKGCVYPRIHYECRMEVAVNGRIYGVFLFDVGVNITIRIKD